MLPLDQTQLVRLVGDPTVASHQLLWKAEETVLWFRENQQEWRSLNTEYKIKLTLICTGTLYEHLELACRIFPYVWHPHDEWWMASELAKRHPAELLLLTLQLFKVDGLLLLVMHELVWMGHDLTAYPMVDDLLALNQSSAFRTLPLRRHPIEVPPKRPEGIPSSPDYPHLHAPSPLVLKGDSVPMPMEIAKAPYEALTEPFRHYNHFLGYQGYFPKDIPTGQAIMSIGPYQGYADKLTIHQESQEEVFHYLAYLVNGTRGSSDFYRGAYRRLNTWATLARMMHMTGRPSLEEILERMGHHSWYVHHMWGFEEEALLCIHRDTFRFAGLEVSN